MQEQSPVLGKARVHVQSVQSSEPSGDLYEVSVVATGFPQIQNLINLFLLHNLPESERTLEPAPLENKMIILIIIQRNAIQRFVCLLT